MLPPDPIARVLAAIAPRADPAVWAAALADPMRSSGIVTPRRIAMFLGQCAEESGGFRVLQEDLIYTASRLCQVWPDRFPTLARAQPYACNPTALGNLVYANRMGNGDEASGDGYRFRGRGLIQLTGRDMVTRFLGSQPDKTHGPEWLATPAGAAASACWFWSTRQLNPLADAWDVVSVTSRINGGLDGLGTRDATTSAALAVLDPSPAV